jgi:hypothetical protein
MSEDTIKVKVNENGQWTEYNLTYEEFDYISPILEKCHNKRVVNFDPNDPEQSAEMFNRIFMPFGMAQQNGRKGVIYNLNEKPHDMSREQVEEIYQRKGILYVESMETRTQPID